MTVTVSEIRRVPSFRVPIGTRINDSRRSSDTATATDTIEKSKGSLIKIVDLNFILNSYLTQFMTSALSSYFQAVWFQTDLRKTIVTSEIPTRSRSIEMLIPKIGEWAHALHQLPPKARKWQIEAVLSWLVEDRTLSLYQIRLGLRLVENVVLDKRVSSLAGKTFYDHRYKSNANHMLTLEGLKHYIDIHFPKLSIFYSKRGGDVDLKQFWSKVVNEPVWVVLEHRCTMHKSLHCCTLSKANKLVIQVFDGVSISPFVNPNSDNTLYKDMITLHQSLADDYYTDHVEYTTQKRQLDSINCASFILHDLQTSSLLLKKGEPLFTKQIDRWILHPDFFSISQYKFPSRRLYVFEEEVSDLGQANPLALFKSVDVFKSFLSLDQFPKAFHHVKGKAVFEEKELVQSCSIM